MKIIVKNLGELNDFAKNFLSTLKRRADGATVIALSGDLGAGKTAFVKCAARYFGLPEEITSPTFVILKRFVIDDPQFKSLIHIDAYRLERGEELDTLRFLELLKNPDNIIFIEWPENVKKVMPSDVISLKLTFIDETTREIEY